MEGCYNFGGCNSKLRAGMVTWDIHYPAIPDDERSVPGAGHRSIRRVAGDRPGAGFLDPGRDI